MKKFNVACFKDGGFQRIESEHNTKEAAVKAAKKLRITRQENRIPYDSCTVTFRVVTAGTLRSAFGLNVR